MVLTLKFERLGTHEEPQQVAQSLCLSDSAVLNMINIHCYISPQP
jgi:hypothetical protein